MHRFAIFAAFVSALFCTAIAHAGPYTDDLSKCLVRSTSSNDEVTFMKWMFSALALHPAISSLASITPQQRAEFQKNAAALIVRLVTADCRQQALNSVKYEGVNEMETSFSVFGQAAMRDLMTNTSVSEGMSTLGTYFQNDQNWLSFLRAAGLAPQPGK